MADKGLEEINEGTFAMIAPFALCDTGLEAQKRQK